MTGTGFNLKEDFGTRVATMRSIGDALELGWHLGFGFQAKLAWGCVGEVHLILYRGVGVWKD
jgi:hypothetical protein